MAWVHRLHADKDRPPAPVTLPKIVIPDVDAEAERKETARRITVLREIRAGLDAWNNISRCCTPAAHRAIGAALARGREHILRVTGQNDTCGGRYTRQFGRWIQEHGFSGMSKSTRAWTLALYDAGEPLLQWWSSLPVAKQRRLLQAQSIVGAWRTAMTPKQKPDALVRAEAAWKHFIGCMATLPEDQSRLLWQAVSVEAARRLRCIDSSAR